MSYSTKKKNVTVGDLMSIKLIKKSTKVEVVNIHDMKKAQLVRKLKRNKNLVITTKDLTGNRLAKKG